MSEANSKYYPAVVARRGLYLKNRKISLEKKVRWTEDYLDKELVGKFEIIRPRMPLQDDAKYEDWKIHFETLNYETR